MLTLFKARVRVETSPTGTRCVPSQVIATTEKSAWFGSVKKPYGPSENQPSTQLTRPYVGSSSQMKMIAVATVLVVTVVAEAPAIVAVTDKADAAADDIVEDARARGVHVIDALPGEVTPALLSHYLDVKARLLERLFEELGQKNYYGLPESEISTEIREFAKRILATEAVPLNAEERLRLGEELAEEAVGLVMPTDGAALIVTRTFEETPMLPKLSVTSALALVIVSGVERPCSSHAWWSRPPQSFQSKKLPTFSALRNSTYSRLIVWYRSVALTEATSPGRTYARSSQC